MPRTINFPYRQTGSINGNCDMIAIAEHNLGMGPSAIVVKHHDCASIHA